MTGAPSDGEGVGDAIGGPLPDRVDVAVVGAGLAGLLAAGALRSGGADVVVLEASHRVGGRLLSRSIGRATLDVGGQWIGPGQSRLLALAHRLGLTTFPTYARGRKVLDLDGRLSTYRGSIPHLPLLSLLDLHLAIRWVERMARRVPVGNPTFAPRARAWDTLTVESWKRKRLRSGAARAVIDPAVRTLFGAEPDELSMLYLLTYARAAGGFMDLVEIEGGAQQDRFVRGAQSLALELARELDGQVITCAPVVRIAQDRHNVLVETERGAVQARFAILALPPALIPRVHFDPPLPAAREELFQRWVMGSLVKCLILYERPFWRERGLSGEAVATRGAASTIFDNTSHDNAQPCLLAFVAGREAREWRQRPESDRRRELLSQLSRYFGNEAQDPIEIVEHDWSAEPWTRGCPVGFVRPGALTTFGASLRHPIGRLHWAGTELATEWPGYMEGAIESGERAAREVLARL